MEENNDFVTLASCFFLVLFFLLLPEPQYTSPGNALYSPHFRIFFSLLQVIATIERAQHFLRIETLGMRMRDLEYLPTKAK